MAEWKRKKEKTLAKTVRDNRRNKKGKEKTEIEEQGRWSELHTDLLELILSRLCLEENIRFSSVCKRWHSAALSVRVVNRSPWLLFSRKTDGMCEFFDPSLRKTYITEIPELSGARICCSKDGWLLLELGSRNMLFFFNPFTKVRIELPKLRLSYENVAFSSAPMSSSCIVFMIQKFSVGVFVSTWRPGAAKWTTVFNHLPFVVGLTNPVFCDGLFYCLNSNMDEVGVFDPEKHTWNVLAVCPPDLPAKVMIGKVMAEFRGDLIMVCMCYHEKPIVFKLDQSNMIWTKVKSFDGLTLFASSSSSHLTIEVPRIMRNSVYFPKVRVYGKRCISYSLDDCRYYPSRDWQDWGEQGPFRSRLTESSIWIEPPKMF